MEYRQYREIQGIQENTKYREYTETKDQTEYRDNRENKDHREYRECREYLENRGIVKIGKESNESRDSTQDYTRELVKEGKIGNLGILGKQELQGK